MKALISPSFAFATLSGEVSLRFKNQKKSFEVKNVATIKTNWSPISNEAGVVLLGKVSDPKNQISQADFLLIDTETTPVRVQEMGVVTKLGSAAEVKNSSENGDAVAVKVTLSQKTKHQCKGQSAIPTEGCETNELGE